MKKCQKWKQESSSIELKNSWTKIECIEYLNPIESNAKNKEKYYIVTFSKNGSAVVVALTDDNEILLLEQFRPAAKKCVINLPGGRINGKNKKQQIKKELKEETGFSFREFKEINNGDLFQNPTRITDKVTIFIAKKVIKEEKPKSKESAEKNARVLKVKLSEIEKLLSGKATEIKGTFCFPKNNTIKIIRKRDFCDMTTIAALSLFILNKNI